MGEVITDYSQQTQMKLKCMTNFRQKPTATTKAEKKPIKNQPIEIDGKNSTQRRRQICGQVVQIY